MEGREDVLMKRKIHLESLKGFDMQVPLRVGNLEKKSFKILKHVLTVSDMFVFRSSDRYYLSIIMDSFETFALNGTVKRILSVMAR